MNTNPIVKFVTKIYEWIITISSNLQSVFIFIMRIFWGNLFLMAGFGKLTHLDKAASFFSSLDIPFPTFTAGMVGTFEFVGGILLIIGLASRLISIPLIVIMLVAYSTAHVDVFSSISSVGGGSFGPKEIIGGLYNYFSNLPPLLVREAPFPYLLTCLIVLFFGPGKISLDGLIKRKVEGKSSN